MLASSYGLRTLEPFRGTPAFADVDPGLAEQAEWAAGLTALDLVRAEDACHRLDEALVAPLREHRLLVTPTCAAPRPESGKLGVIDGVPQQNWVRFTSPFNLTRSPTASVPVGFTAGGLRVGLQLVGPQHAEVVGLRSAAALEAALGIREIAGARDPTGTRPGGAG
jgi:aspartyl-tRNA(Asn)/glutamyl-tRNA(Gln) amidotransferase subunit A